MKLSNMLSLFDLEHVQISADSLAIKVRSVSTVKQIS